MDFRIDGFNIGQSKIDIGKYLINHRFGGEAACFNSGVPAFGFTGFKQLAGKFRLRQRFTTGQGNPAA